MNKSAGLARPSVYAWKTTSTKRVKTINADHAAMVCEWLDINISWLFLNKGDSGIIKSDGRRIAKLYESLSPVRRQAAEQMLMGFVALEKAEQEAMPFVASLDSAQERKA